MSEADNATPIADPDEQMLARLAALDLAAAEKAHGKLMAAEEAGEIAELGRTYQRLARSLRQTLALKARLAREREMAANQPKPPRSGPGAHATVKRMRELRLGVVRVIWDEQEREDALDLEDALDGLIARDSFEDDFAAEPLDDHVARICLELGLSPQGAEHWRDLPDPTDAGPPPEEPDQHESSA